MLAERADRPEEADKLTDCGMPLYLSTFIPDAGRPADTALDPLFFSVPFFCVLFAGLICVASVIYDSHLFPRQPHRRCHTAVFLDGCHGPSPCVLYYLFIYLKVGGGDPDPLYNSSRVHHLDLILVAH